MYKKPITFTDLDGKTVTEDFYFHLSKADLIQLELREKGGFRKKLQQIIDEEDGEQIVNHFKDIIRMSYGVRGDDGRRFRKKDDNGVPLFEAFSETDAYSELFSELATESDAAAKFIQGVVPEGLVSDDELQQALDFGEGDTLSKSLPTAPPALEKSTDAGPEKQFGDFTRQELLDMGDDQFTRLVGDDPMKMTQQQLQIAMQRKTR